MALVCEIRTLETPQRVDEIEFLFYRFITLMQVENPEDLAVGRSVLRMDTAQHFKDYESYYRQRFNAIRRNPVNKRLTNSIDNRCE